MWAGDCKDRDLRNGEETIEHVGSGPLVTCTGENRAIWSLCLWVAGPSPLDSPAVVTFLLLHFSHFVVFLFCFCGCFSPPLFKSQKKKSVMGEE